ncbi:23S rRNA (guanosine(2251)-2'-O)-methyltransferase RlmB [Isachenkonia alkalipeptolytica]|uniref:23S rRNA (Guanosine(2251)-2'-O)-methyltransferase RlmB n=2 Tax=Isachenkonia alkalipeptolytica TaxID=2565777 RepID=A0AA43XMN2_9CLOT|nr:23S rRNA (guanosine(2251)-2'-O)-methyltransferase RlmB [Isachenkonia alkalipeptolytica]
MGKGKAFEKRPRKESEPEPGTEESTNQIEGRNPVIEALKSEHPINKILIDSGDKKGSVVKIVGMAKEKGVMVKYVDRKKLDEISATRNHQGVIAEIAAYETVELEDLLEKTKGKEPFFLILDEIMDPHNLGSMVRTANAAGVDGIIIPKRRSVGLTVSVAKVAQGALEHVPVAKVPNIAQTMDRLKEQGLWIAGADMKGEQLHYEANLLGPIALVIGGEGKGLSELTKKKCDFLVKLPMEGAISSLNASVAGAVLMYEVVRQRKTKEA